MLFRVFLTEPLIEPKKVELAEKKQEISNLIRNSGLPTSQRLFFLGQLDDIESLENLENFKKILDGQIALA